MDSGLAKGLMMGRLADYMFDYSCLCVSGRAWGQHSATPVSHKGESPVGRAGRVTLGAGREGSVVYLKTRRTPGHYKGQRQTPKHRVSPACHWPCPLHRLLAYFSLGFFHLNSVLGVGAMIPARLTA